MISKYIKLFSFALIFIIVGVFANETNYFRIYIMVNLYHKMQDHLYLTSKIPRKFDSMGRLIFHAGKTVVPCPTQNNDLIVILAMGQSNSSNSLGQRYFPHNAGRVLNLWDGKCYLASSPLLGANGVSGELWSLLGDKIIDRSLNPNLKVLIISAGIGGTNSRRWSDSGDLLQDLIIRVKSSGYKVTYVFFLQGESDYIEEISYSEYMKNIHTMGFELHRNFSSPIFVSVSTKCNNYNWTNLNPIAAAQHDIVDNIVFFAGPNADRLIGDAERFDGCHFGFTGMQIYTEELLNSLDNYSRSKSIK